MKPYAFFTPAMLRRIMYAVEHAPTMYPEQDALDAEIIAQCDNQLSPNIQRTPVSPLEEMRSRQGIG